MRGEATVTSRFLFLFSHLKDLHISNAKCEKLESILNYIFENNENKLLIDVLIIDYDDNITVNLKDEGKRDIIKNHTEFGDDEQITCS